MINTANTLANLLSDFNPAVKIASSGSVYIYLSGSKVKCIRVADHNGHSLKPWVWELRSDAMTTRKKLKNRVYNVSAIKSLIADVKLKIK